MARPRNPRQRASIEVAASELFLGKGYAATSYADIAAAAGADRSLVQYYHPRKVRLVADVLNRVLVLAEKEIRAEGLEGDDGYVELFRIGQLYFAFLLEEGAGVLMHDVVSSREITSELVFLNEQWAAGFLHPDTAQREEFGEDFAMVVGGTYELCFRHLRRGEEIDVAHLVGRMLTTFMTLTGHELSEARSILEDAPLDRPVLDELAGRLRAHLRTSGPSGPPGTREGPDGGR